MKTKTILLIIFLFTSFNTFAAASFLPLILGKALFDAAHSSVASNNKEKQGNNELLIQSNQNIEMSYRFDAEIQKAYPLLSIYEQMELQNQFYNLLMPMDPKTGGEISIKIRSILNESYKRRMYFEKMNKIKLIDMANKDGIECNKYSDIEFETTINLIKAKLIHWPLIFTNEWLDSCKKTIINDGDEKRLSIFK